MTPRDDWWHDAACIGLWQDHDAVIESMTRARAARPSWVTRLARPILDRCGDCPVRRECYADGVTHQGSGIYGGVLMVGGTAVRRQEAA